MALVCFDRCGGFTFNISLNGTSCDVIEGIYIVSVFVIKCISVLNQVCMFTMKQEMIYTLYLITLHSSL